MTRQEGERLVLNLYNQGNTIREIAKQTRMSFRDIGVILNKVVEEKAEGVESFFGWLKSSRRIQTRYERLASTYLGFIQLGCIMILMRLFR